MAVQLWVSEGPLAGATYSLAAGESVIGRESGVTLQLNDQTVSRRHAKFEVINDTVTVTDLGSSSGTFVNDIRIPGPSQLRPGDSIRFGATKLILQKIAQGPVTTQAGTMPGRKSRRTQERSRGEAAAVPAQSPLCPSLSQNPGCMPDFEQLLKDAQGCLGPFLKILIIFIIVCLIGALIMGAIAVIGMMGAAGGATGAAGSAAAGGASGAGAGGDGDQGAGGDQPPPAQPDQQQQQSQQGIQIESADCKYLIRPGASAPVPVALVVWKNVGNKAVTQVFADVDALDTQGKVIGTVKHLQIYKGQAVIPQQEHRDLEATEGEIIKLENQTGSTTPLISRIVVKPTEVSTSSG